MRPKSDRSSGRTAHGRVVLVAVVTLCALFAGSSSAQDVNLVPAAPPVNAELVYNIPIPPWVVPPVLNLKTQFIDGLASELVAIAAEDAGESVTVLRESGSDLGDAAERVVLAIRAIGEDDVTFGIDGISRIIPAQGALRDTLFGFVVWHESPTGDSRGLMTQFEDLVGRIETGGAGSSQLAQELATMQEQLDEAIEAEDGGRIAELAPRIAETCVRIDAVAKALADISAELDQLVAEISTDSPTLLVDKWRTAREAVGDCAEPFQRTQPALQTTTEVLQALLELSDVIARAGGSVDALSAEPDADGNVYIPWVVVRDDWEVVKELEEHLFSGEDVEYPQDSMARVRSFYPNQVQAGRILAQTAIEHTAAEVARALDNVEERYMDNAGFSPTLSERRQRIALENVDEAMRENFEVASAKVSAKASRSSFDRARSEQSMGAGHEAAALYHYHNAWLHCLNAGASAQRAVEAAR